MIMMVYSQGELGQPGLPGPTGPIAVGIQGEKVRATSLSKCYLIAFICSDTYAEELECSSTTH